jgi:type IV pilus assembly protein PilA
MATSTERHALSRSDGFTLIELLATVALVGILAALTVPGLLRAKMAANEASAIGSLKAINAAQVAYAATVASGGYATQLSVLGTRCPAQSTAFLSPDLAADPSIKSGYIIVLGPGASGPGPNDCNGNPTREGYYLTAEPASPGATGRRAFATSSAQVIYFVASGTPPSEASIASGGGATPIE